MEEQSRGSGSAPRRSEHDDAPSAARVTAEGGQLNVQQQIKKDIEQFEKMDPTEQMVMLLKQQSKLLGGLITQTQKNNITLEKNSSSIIEAVENMNKTADLLQKTLTHK